MKNNFNRILKSFYLKFLIKVLKGIGVDIEKYKIAFEDYKKNLQEAYENFGEDRHGDIEFNYQLLSYIAKKLDISENELEKFKQDSGKNFSPLKICKISDKELEQILVYEYEENSQDK